MGIVTVYVAKGGAGKTTTAAHILGGMAIRGYHALGIDLNPQAHLCAGLGVESGESAAAWAMGFGSAHLEEMAVEARPGVLVLPANEMLAQAEVAMQMTRKPVTDLRQKIRKQWHGPLTVIDTSDHGYFSEMAIAAADVIVVPVPTRAKDVSVFLPTLETIKAVRGSVGLPPARIVVLPTMHDLRNSESAVQLATLKSLAAEHLSKTSGVAAPVGVAVDIDRAGRDGKLLWEYSPNHERVGELRDGLIDSVVLALDWTAFVPARG
ncbi:MAG: ParA family protein [Caldilinea sp.]|nr:ParA family protein [Caldilinea sp.]MCW5844347.1 ParA family protein [Caldilinea sp.]